MSHEDLDASRDEIVRRLQQIHRLHLTQRQPRQHLQMRNMEGEGEVLSPMAVSIMGMNGTIQQAAQQEAHVASVAQMATSRISRRAQSYFNAFQTTCTPAQDDPPSYATAARQKHVARRETDDGRELLPKYTCTVSAGATMLVNMESVSPLHSVSQSEWREVYVEVCGTMLNFHRVKDGRPSRLLRSYTLQHAEIGLAPDAFHTILAPNSKLAHLIPSAARQKAFKKDPQLFRAEEQFIMRLRVETDQLLLAHKSEDKILEMVHEIGAGIDLAPAIDERSISKQCTVPRRRRRNNSTPASNDINNATVIAEQERILQQMYPQFAEDRNEQNATTIPTTSSPPSTETQATTLSTPTREDEELDLSAIREDFSENQTLTPSTTNTGSSSAVRPPYSRTTTASSTTSYTQTYETAPTNFGPEGKWQPPHLRTAAQIRRYVRRCAPLLTSEAVRASDMVICNGKRMRINWREERLEKWSLQPPTYKAHDFEKEQQKKQDDTAAGASALATSMDSTLNINTNESASTNTPSSLFSVTSSSSSHDDITPLEEQNNNLMSLELVKTSTASSALAEKKNSIPAARETAPTSRQKTREMQRENSAVDTHGVMFCF